MKKTHRLTAKAFVAGLTTSVVMAATCFTSAVQAMSLGHSRLLSPVGQPLRVQTPVLGLSVQESESLSVVIAPAPAWKDAGLVPPVDVSTLQVGIIDGVRPGSKLVTISSPQPLASGVADLLLVVRSASGLVQHQVSVLAPADMQVASAAVAQFNRDMGAARVGATPGTKSSGNVIAVQQGDTLFSLARKHATPGVSIYQWMVAVQRANPSAFILDNVNLVKAGATLVVPDQAALTALSDAQARRVFQQHAQAFAEYRQRVASANPPEVKPGSADQGPVSVAAPAATVPTAGSGQDKVVLSGAPSDTAGAKADDALALQKNTEEAQQRLASLEDNVRDLNQALQQQGAVASEIASDSVEAVADVVEKAVDALTGSDSDSISEQGKASQGKSTEPAASGSGESGSSVGDNSAASPSLGQNTSTSQQSAAGSLPGLSVTAPSASSSVAETAAAKTSTTSSKSVSFVSWFQDHLLTVISGIVVLVLLIVWLLRRIGGSSATQGGITEEMVRERLQGINLDLDEPPKGGSDATR